MAKPLVFLLGDEEIALQMSKIDRARVYGSKEVEAVNEADQPCELATLADDGRTVIGKGGTGFGWLDADGKWCSKSELSPHDIDGQEIRPVESSFNAPIKLFETASPENLLEYNIRLVYTLDALAQKGEDAAVGDSGGLQAELQRGTIFRFPYSYRGGLEADTAFLMMNEQQDMMLLVGDATRIDYVGLQSQLLRDSDEDEDQPDADQLLDFEMI